MQKCPHSLSSKAMFSCEVPSKHRSTGLGKATKSLSLGRKRKRKKVTSFDFFSHCYLFLPQILLESGKKKEKGILSNPSINNVESHPSTISSCLYKAPRDWFQLIIYFNSYLIKPIHGKEIRSHCTDYLIDPLLNVKFLHLDQFKILIPCSSLPFFSLDFPAVLLLNS